MQPLDKTLRNQLERAVKNARDTAETGARAALDQLGVADPTPAAHLSETERELRRRLRAHGRQLGDSLNGGKVQSMDRLVEEVAYEHWHRMLRSEEHTSELQSRPHLVCRLLLEKKKKKE